MEKSQQQDKAFASINTKSFILVVCILLAIIVLSTVLSYIVPQGSYERDENGMIIDGTFAQGEVQGIAIWKVITAPFRVFASSDALTVIFISIFLLIMSGVFNVIEKTGGVKAIINRTVKKFGTKKKVVICLITLVFMLFGSFFGMFEELVALLPIILVFVLFLGYDTLTGLGVCLIAPCFGFAAAITNPFSVGIVSNIAGVNVLDGAWFRAIFFVLVYLAVCAFLILHIRKIEKNPQKSLTYEMDKNKRNSYDFTVGEGDAKENKAFKVYSVFFVVLVGILLAIASIRAISDYAIPILALSFLVGGFISGYLVSDKFSKVGRWFVQGAVAMLPAVLMIAMAMSVKLILSESGILDTVMHGVVGLLSGQSKFVCVVLIYALVLFLQLFIGSATAKAMLVMPIIFPIASMLGLSPSIVILTYCMADGFTNVFMPTNAVLLIGLSMANVSYGKWFKWTWKLQLLMLLGTVLLLFVGVQIGY